MVKSKILTISNVSLFLIAVILTLTLFEVQLPTLGRSIEQLEEKSFCVMKTWEGDYVVRDISSCCNEKKKIVLECNQQELYFMDQTLSWQCYTGNKINYYFNSAGYDYCQKLN